MRNEQSVLKKTVNWKPQGKRFRGRPGLGMGGPSLGDFKSTGMTGLRE